MKKGGSARTARSSLLRLRKSTRCRCANNRGPNARASDNGGHDRASANCRHARRHRNGGDNGSVRWYASNRRPDCKPHKPMPWWLCRPKPQTRSPQQPHPGSSVFSLLSPLRALRAASGQTTPHPPCPFRGLFGANVAVDGIWELK